ncbi:Transcriptional regulator containing PAS, AAA-type ATPase, and DNA-binding Fis domains [Natronincola peptidivorans]|uniref:Transcriptional regulator containing PAS, AAA-type ATPase, and DNA-binding Fis domains n=1 Tax=Natronincola peptidivorans TaxID=426128 RepID=A0A1I0GXL0_9FIRM|nr:sigma 54-interacting transcriptional regulator [Natronincola peptidivorans]SET75082.1 Transcriptional regulator containing PAS, AAA-type ATPase, and DNA-binding Fis domains [Natronincola peptidivorans]
MALIGYIAPNENMVGMAQKVFQEKKAEVEIEVGHIELGVKKAEILINRGVQIIISRGGTALNIRKQLNVPVVEIPITAEDIARAIIKASKIGNKIVIIGFFNLLKGLETFNPLLNIELQQMYVETEEDTYEAVLKAKEEGAEVIVGGSLQHKIAKELEMKSVFLETGPQAIEHAYLEAEALLNTLLKERQRAEEIQAIFDYARDGFLAVNEKGIITLMNATAAKLMNCKIEDTIGKHLKDKSPSLINLMEVMEQGKEGINDITTIGATTIIYNRIPIIVHQETVGAVAIFQDINILQEAETKIRKFYTAGLYAKHTLKQIDGYSVKIRKAKEFAEKFAKTDSTILLTGESGTGKEIFSQSIHNASYRKKGPFVAVNCASLPESLLESELFGYVEGAFTGARKTGKPGLFELAHKGTIFLDEISEIPLPLQGRLLRVLQEKSVMRLGDDKFIPIDVRVVAATNRDLVHYVNESKFREDLFFRINILRLHLPPLVERLEDIEILANKFLEEYNRELVLSEEALQVLLKHTWPGNVRELRNLLERISIVTTSKIIDHRLIEAFLEENKRLFRKESYRKETPKDQIALPQETATPSKEEIEKALEAVGHNKTKAAKILGVSRSTLWRWLKNNM